MHVLTKGDSAALTSPTRTTSAWRHVSRRYACRYADTKLPRQACEVASRLTDEMETKTTAAGRDEAESTTADTRCGCRHASRTVGVSTPRACRWLESRELSPSITFRQEKCQAITDQSITLRELKAENRPTLGKNEAKNKEGNNRSVNNIKKEMPEKSERQMTGTARQSL